MPIKRLTIELDDSPDLGRPTGVPESVRQSGTDVFKDLPLTTTPSEKASDETEFADVGRATLKAPGWTAADLIAESVNDARAMATILMFAPFVLFVAKIQTFKDLFTRQLLVSCSMRCGLVCLGSRAETASE